MVSPIGRIVPRRLPLLTNSSVTAYRRCPREYMFRYVLLRKPKKKTAALKFGSFFHLGLNAWWGCNGTPGDKLEASFDALRGSKEEQDPFDVVKAEELLTGYTVRWGAEDYVTKAVEMQFRIPLTSSRFDVGGAIDAIVERCGKVHNVEHKTTSDDISPGSDYWQHVSVLDTQVSTYHEASRTLGFNAVDTIYDVIRKPNIAPLKATPPESRKYTKPTKSEPVPRLYAYQREWDETPEQFRTRLRDDIASNPDAYYARANVVRLEEETEAHERDLRDTAFMIEVSQEKNAWPRHPNACRRFGRLCEYHGVCSGLIDINSDAHFATKATAHEELSE